MSAELASVQDDDALPDPRGAPRRLGGARRGIGGAASSAAASGSPSIVSLGVTVASLVTPVLIQKVFDNGSRPVRPRATRTRSARRRSCSWSSRSSRRGSAGRRLVVAAENAMMQLRVRTFSHIHALSIADQSEEKRGVFVARVTADIDALQQFMEWGGIAWIISLDAGDRRARL